MKTRFWMIMAAVLATLVWAGCSKKSAVDTSALEKSFQSGEPAAQTTANQAVDAIKKGDYSTALSTLQKAASQAKLTSDQQQAIKDTIQQVQKAIGDAVGKAADGANKALGDVQKSLPK